MTEEMIVEETVTEEVEAVVAPTEFTGLSAKLNDAITDLAKARDAAYMLESGLDTKSSINKAAKKCRDTLHGLRQAFFDTRKEVLDIRNTLLDGVGEVQSVNKKEALLAKKAEIEAALAAMGV